MRKFLGITILVILLIAVGIIYWRFYWVFGEGVKAGELNFVVKKGYVFKTYEGKLIQAGYRPGVAGGIQSYEFEFSITNKTVAEKLMLNSGKHFELHYKEFLGKLPWRGNTVFLVDSIIAMKDPKTGALLQ